LIGDSCVSSQRKLLTLAQLCWIKLLTRHSRRCTAVIKSMIVVSRFVKRCDGGNLCLPKRSSYHIGKMLVRAPMRNCCGRSLSAFLFYEYSTFPIFCIYDSFYFLLKLCFAISAYLCSFFAPSQIQLLQDQASLHRLVCFSLIRKSSRPRLLL